MISEKDSIQTCPFDFYPSLAEGKHSPGNSHESAVMNKTYGSMLFLFFFFPPSPWEPQEQQTRLNKKIT